MTARHWLYVVAHAVVFLLGVFLAYEGSPVIQGIGASLIAAGVTGWVIFVYVFVSSEAAARIALIEAAGLREVFPYRSVSIRAKYVDRLNVARESIDIIGYGLRALREDLGGEFQAWASKARVRILLVDPEFPDVRFSIANLRDAEEGNPEGSIQRDVRAFVSHCATLMQANERFRIRLYRAIPAVNYFRVDDEAFWGPFLVGLQSRNTPTFLVKRSGFLFAPLLGHFEGMWGSDQLSREVPPEWLTERDN